MVSGNAMIKLTNADGEGSLLADETPTYDTNKRTSCSVLPFFVARVFSQRYALHNFFLLFLLFFY
jgi:hypothetical protein